MDNMSSQQQVFIKMAMDAWQTQNSRVDKLMTTLTDDQFSSETAPGRNSGVYLFGHLAAVNDGLFPLLGLGERLYPELETVFLKNPDKSGLAKPSLAVLKDSWKKINTKLAEHFAKLQPDEWFTRHNSVSAEDFEKEPHRNKLNILVNRANHASYHLGQMAYLK
jgi:DinB superfamily